MGSSTNYGRKHTKLIPGLAFKVDFVKAFDSLDWNFLLEVLAAIGFGLRWISWIQTPLSPLPKIEF